MKYSKSVLNLFIPHRFCEKEDPNFDAYLNLKQLQEILLSILSIHENLQYSIKTPDIDLTDEKLKKEEVENEDPHFSDDEELIEAMGLLTTQDVSMISVSSHNMDDPKEGDDSDYSNIRVTEETEMPKKTDCCSSSQNLLKYSEMEEVQSLYLLIHLGNSEAISHALSLPNDIR